MTEEEIYGELGTILIESSSPEHTNVYLDVQSITVGPPSHASMQFGGFDSEGNEINVKFPVSKIGSIREMAVELVKIFADKGNEGVTGFIVNVNTIEGSFKLDLKYDVEDN